MLIAAPNLALDRIDRIDELRPGRVLRFSASRVVPGGKGINVARAVRPLGGHAVVVGLVPGRTGAAVAGLVAEEGIRLRSVRCTGEVRAAIIVLEAEGRVTVMNEPGPQVVPRSWSEFMEAVVAEMTAAEARAESGRWLVCSGSAPPGAPDSAYADLVNLAREHGWQVLVDASGPLLERALDRGPDVVAPNLAEAEALLGGSPAEDVDLAGPDARARAAAAASGLRGRGAGAALVTAGAAGLAVEAAGQQTWIAAPRVTVVNPVGAGDALVGALVGALERGDDLAAAAVHGAAAAAASVETEIPARLSKTRVAELQALLEAGVTDA